MFDCASAYFPVTRVYCRHGAIKRNQPNADVIYLIHNMNQNRRPKKAYVRSHRSDVRPISMCFKGWFDIRNIWKCSVLLPRYRSWRESTGNGSLAFGHLSSSSSASSSPSSCSRPSSPVEGLILISSPDYYAIVQSIRMQNILTVAWSISFPNETERRRVRIISYKWIDRWK